MYAREVNSEATVHEFASSEEFEKHFFLPLVTASTSHVAESDPKAPAPPKPKALDIVIFRASCLKGKDAREWVTKAATLMKKAGLWPDEGRPKFVVLRFEDDQEEKSELLHPFIDDLIIMPPDRLVVLQKLEIALKVPEKVTPTYLFVQSTDEPIDVAKKVEGIHMTDLSVTVLNPVPVAVGALANLRFRLGRKEEYTFFYGRVLKCEPHGDDSGMYAVTFGISLANKNTLKELRAYVTKDPAHKLLRESDPKVFEFNPDNIFLGVEEKQLKTVAVIDPDEAFGRHLAEGISREIGNTRCIYENSWAAFYQKYLASMNSRKATPAKPEDFFHLPLEFIIDLKQQELKSIEIPANSDAELRFLGWLVNELFAPGNSWKSLLADAGTEAIFKDLLKSLPLRKRVRQNLNLCAAGDELSQVAVEILLEADGESAKVVLTPPEANISNFRVQPLESLDAILIHSALIPSERDVFFKSVNQAITDKMIRAPLTGPSFFVLAETQEIEKQKEYLDFDFQAVLHKPIDLRHLYSWLSATVKTPFTMYNLSNIGTRAEKIDVKLGAEATLVELSEFGASVKLNRKLKAGSMVYLFGSIFKSAPAGNICCRVYNSEEDNDDKGMFINHLVYFGINERFLKLTRSYIRETYATGKAKESNG